MAFTPENCSHSKSFLKRGFLSQETRLLLLIKLRPLSKQRRSSHPSCPEFADKNGKVEVQLGHSGWFHVLEIHQIPVEESVQTRKMRKVCVSDRTRQQTREEERREAVVALLPLTDGFTEDPADEVEVRLKSVWEEIRSEGIRV